MHNSDIPSYSNISFDVSLLLPQGPDITSDVLKDSVQDIHSFFKKFPIRYEVLSNPSIVDALQNCKGRYIFCLDAHLSTPLVEVFQSLQTFHESPELQFIFGDRTQPKKKPRGLPSKKQIYFEKCLDLFINQNFKSASVDLYCPYVCFHFDQKSKVIELIQKSSPYYFIFLKKWTQDQKIPIHNQPVHWQFRNYPMKLQDLLKTALLTRRNIF